MSAHLQLMVLLWVIFFRPCIERNSHSPVLLKSLFASSDVHVICSSLRWNSQQNPCRLMMLAKQANSWRIIKSFEHLLTQPSCSAHCDRSIEQLGSHIVYLWHLEYYIFLCYHHTVFVLKQFSWPNQHVSFSVRSKQIVLWSMYKFSNMAIKTTFLRTAKCFNQ